jgi:hypothetical protein
VAKLAYDDLLLAAASTLLLILCVFLSGLILSEIGAQYRLGANRRRRHAERRASDLLKEWLSPTQRAQYECSGEFEVRGSHSGNRYRIRRAQQMNVDELDDRGRRIAVWCFLPEDVPVGDVMLAQKIVLENDEPAMLRIARVNRAGG